MSDWRDVPRVAAIGPYPAQWLTQQLAVGARVTKADVRAHAQWLREIGREGLARQVESAWAQLEASAAQHREQAAVRVLRGERPGLVSVNGSGEAETGGASAECGVKADVTTKEAAEMLGLKSERRVGQMLAAGTLKGRKAGRSWLVDRASVESLRDARSAS